MLSIDMLDFSGFNAWTIISRVWAFTAATFIIVVPLVQEVKYIFLILMLIFFVEFTLNQLHMYFLLQKPAIFYP